MSCYPFPMNLDVFGSDSLERELCYISQSDMVLLSTCSWKVRLSLSSQGVHWFVPSSNINLRLSTLTLYLGVEYRSYTLRNILKPQISCRMPCSSSLPKLNHSILLYSCMGHLWTFVDTHAWGICPEYVHSCCWYSVYKYIVQPALPC